MVLLCVLVPWWLIWRVMRLLIVSFILVAFAANVSAEFQKTRPAAKLYPRYCASCHGTDGKATTSKGKFNHARDLSDPEWQTEVSDARIFNSIMNGRNVRGNMPPFGNKLKEKEIDSLVEYVRRLKG